MTRPYCVLYCYEQSKVGATYAYIDWSLQRRRLIFCSDVQVLHSLKSWDPCTAGSAGGGGYDTAFRMDEILSVLFIRIQFKSLKI